jgi:hypothetical protein
VAEPVAAVSGEVGVRGDLALSARLLLRREGLAGATMALGGGLVAAATLVPWLRAVTAVDMLGRSDIASIGTTTLLPGPAGWVIITAACLLVVCGVGIAVDRPLPRAGTVAVLAMSVAAAAALAVSLPVPTPEDIAGLPVAELAAIADQLPSGVAVTFAAQPAAGVWLLTTGIAAAVLGTIRARHG